MAIYFSFRVEKINWRPMEIQMGTLLDNFSLERNINFKIVFRILIN